MRAVPLEPTEEMIGDMIDGWFETPPTDEYRHEPRFIERMRLAYKAMLGAAPAPVDGLVERLRGEVSEGRAGFAALPSSSSLPGFDQYKVAMNGLLDLLSEAAAALQSRDEPVAWTDETYDAIWKDFCEWCPEHLRPRLSIMHIREFLKCMKKQIDATTPPRKP